MNFMVRRLHTSRPIVTSITILSLKVLKLENIFALLIYCGRILMLISSRVALVVSGKLHISWPKLRLLEAVEKLRLATLVFGQHVQRVRKAGQRKSSKAYSKMSVALPGRCKSPGYSLTPGTVCRTILRNRCWI